MITHKKNHIDKASKTFKLAIKSSQHPDIVFNYAVFLQSNNQYKLAEDYYQQILKSYRGIAQHNPQTYQAKVAMTLYNLAGLGKS